MIKAIIFDFDGVIVESAQVKTEAFRKLFSKWPNKVDEIVSYHIKNMGVSRYVKFKYFYENILKVPYSQEISSELGRQFSDIVLDEIKKAPLVKGMKEFLNNDHKKYLLFIASGTPQEELDDIIYFKGLSKYFISVFGTPATKTEIVNNILKEYNLEKDKVVFIGDAESDKRAAEETGIHFILRVTPENIYLIDSNVPKIHDFIQLKDKIKEIEK
ncbi:Phosphoglycolate phosphatase [uncultured archaeon]|nr:Phosphoglycolate phosphatase [uncultured archaeon]